VYGPSAEQEERWWRADDLPLSKAIQRAVASKLENRSHHKHQSIIRRQAYADCEAALLAKQRQLRKARNFDELLKCVDTALHKISGAGEMIVYDVADRIALHLGLEPTHVYLHRGTRYGAMALVGDITGKLPFIDVAELPAPLRQLTPRELENALCIYAALFRQWRNEDLFKPALLRK
jgi:hypothetical protein